MESNNDISNNIKAFYNFSVGESNFNTIVQKNLSFIDKSLLIKEVIDRFDDNNNIKFIIRPKGFGKSLNLSMLNAFFSNQTDIKVKKYFWKLKIWKENNKYHNEMGKYPVIQLNFKDLLASSYAEFIESFKFQISDLYENYKDILFDGYLKYNEFERNYYETILSRASDDILIDSIKKLIEYLSYEYKNKVIVLVDEYDSPHTYAFLHNYLGEVQNFFGRIFLAAFKDNKNLKQVILVGVSVIAKENSFTGLNNYNVYSQFSEAFSSSFGLLPEEIKSIEENLDDNLLIKIQEWYGGYQIGNNILCNTSSVVSFFMNYEENKQIEFSPYYILNFDSQFIQTIISEYYSRIYVDFVSLLEGNKIKKDIDEYISFDDINKNDNAIWNFLLANGFLSGKEIDLKSKYKKECQLWIQNKEILYFYNDLNSHLKLGKSLILPNEPSNLDSEYMQEIIISSFPKIIPAKDKDVVLMIGDTGVGKSTLINYLMGCKMEKTSSLINDFIKVHDIEYAKIGHGSITTTIYPEVNIYRESIAFCDLPAVIDNRSPEISACNIINTQFIINVSKSIKAIMVVLDINMFRARGNSGFISTINFFEEFLKEIEPQSIIFIFNKFHANFNIALILDHVEAIVNDIKEKLETNIKLNKPQKELLFIDKKIKILKLINNNNSFMINMLDNGECKTKLLEALDSNTPISKQNFKFNQYDSNVINYSNFIFKASQKGNRIITKYLNLIDYKAKFLNELKNFEKIMKSYSNDSTTYSSNNISKKQNTEQKINAISINNIQDECIKLESEISNLLEELGQLDTSEPILYWEKDIKEERSYFAFFGWTNEKFDYKGIPFLKVDTKVENGRLTDIYSNPSEGIYRATYTSDTYKNGIASIKIYIEKRNKIDNKNRIQDIKNDLLLKQAKHKKLKESIRQAVELNENNLSENHPVNQHDIQNKIISLKENILSADKELLEVESEITKDYNLFIIIKNISSVINFNSALIKTFLNSFIKYLNIKSETSNNTAVNLFLEGEKTNISHLKFDTIYNFDICHYLLQLVNNDAKFIRVIFLDTNYKYDKNLFIKQLRELALLSYKLNRPSIFISKEPGVKDHIICGIIKNRNLLFINPLGTIHHIDCYQSLAELMKEKIINQLWFSNNSIQKQNYEKNRLVSSGAIVLEFVISILTKFSFHSFNDIWGKLVTNELILHEQSGLRYSEIDISNILPNSLLDVQNSVSAKNYKKLLCKIRYNHYRLLQLLPFERAEFSNTTVEVYLNKCRKEAPSQVIFNALVSDNKIDINALTEFDLLKNELNIFSEYDEHKSMDGNIINPKQKANNLEIVNPSFHTINADMKLSLMELQNANKKKANIGQDQPHLQISNSNIIDKKIENSQIIQEKRIWATENFRSKLYPVLDKFLETLISNKIKIANPEEKYRKNISERGCQLFNLNSDPKKFLAIIKFFDGNDVKNVVNIINEYNSDFEAKDMKSSNLPCLAIYFDCNQTDKDIRNIIYKLEKLLNFIAKELPNFQQSLNLKIT